MCAFIDAIRLLDEFLVLRFELELPCVFAKVTNIGLFLPFATP
jgi:hypothetical protein